jgi:hypothetical protein
MSEYQPPPRSIISKLLEYPSVLISGLWWWITRRPPKDRPRRKGDRVTKSSYTEV